MRAWIAAALMWGTPALAQVSPIAPFTGEFAEGFENFYTTEAVDCFQPTFGGHASVCAPNAALGGMNARYEIFGSGQCLFAARTGDRLGVSNDSWVEIDFDVPIREFGGYFGTHGDTGTVTFIFFDDQGAEIGRDSQPMSTACVWTWHGYELPQDQPAWTVRIRHSEHAGALVDMDDLRASTGCGLDDLDCDGSPAAQDCDDLDPRRTPGATEVCDGIDNDCDGQVPANELDGDLDGYAGCLDCDDENPDVYPGATEVCNGLDDDCSGVVDDGLSGAPLAVLQSGVCAGAEQVCDPNTGGWVEPDYTTLPDYEADESSCDGLDNDCDGLADNDLSDPPTTSFGDGVCAEVPQECDSTQGWVDPTDWQDLVDYEDPEVTCDGQDNDCDGQVDEGLEAPDGTLQDGVCAGSVKSCGGQDGWLEPDYEALSGYGDDTSCDTLDNDCDGRIDESCVPGGDTGGQDTGEPDDDGFLWSDLCGCQASPLGASPVWWVALAAVARRRRR